MYQQYLDRVVAFATGPGFQDEVALARKEFFTRTGGEVFEDDRSVESRLASFLDWYLFDRPLRAQGVPPVEAFLIDQADQIRPEELPAFRDLTRQIHGLFEVRRPLKKDRLKIRELCTGEDYEVHERRQLAGLEKGDLFEARLIPSGELLQFSASFCHHPRAARRAILSEVKRRRKEGPIDRASFLHLLSAMALKYERYRNVVVGAIYSFDSRGGSR
jgi:hypothetical protein